MCVYSMVQCIFLFNIRSIELHTLHLNRVFSSESVHYLREGGRYYLVCHYTDKLKASVTYIYIGILWPLEIKQLTVWQQILEVYFWELNLTSMAIIHFKLKLMG